MVTMDVLMEQCAPQVSPALMKALVRAESAWRPFAIGMDRTQGTVKQPASLPEAVAVAKELVAGGRKFSVGLAQIHVSNVTLYGMTWEQAFDACHNLTVGQKILWNFYHRASATGYTGVAAIWAALRGYNSGRVDRAVGDEYANRIFAYMSSAPQNVQFGSGNAIPKTATAATRSPSTVAGTAAPVDKAQRAGESVEIFEKSRPAGF